MVNLVVLPYFLYLLAIAVAAMSARRTRTTLSETQPRSRMLVVIPAHDEETGVANTVASCRSADYPESLFSVLVIADNCTDRTAATAAEAGARVVERSDPIKRSKGYAIEYLIGRLAGSGELAALDALVVVDADTTIDRSLLRRFDAHLQAGHDWVQAYYTVANPDESWRTRLMTHAFALFNGVMQLGHTALGTSAGLRGNGMCFSTRGLSRQPWVSYGLVEDMEFSWTLRLAGERIAFEPASRVYGAMLGSGGTAAANQRRRWEFGRGEVRRMYTGLVLLLRPDRLAGEAGLAVRADHPHHGPVAVVLRGPRHPGPHRVPDGAGRRDRIPEDPPGVRSGDERLGRAVRPVPVPDDGAAVAIRQESGVDPRVYRLEVPGRPARTPHGLGADGAGGPGRRRGADAAGPGESVNRRVSPGIPCAIAIASRR